MTVDKKLKDTINLIEECMHSNKIEFLANLIIKLENEYIDIARVATDDNYKPNWTHTEVLDYLTYEQRP
jgi:hypothetical protein